MQIYGWELLVICHHPHKSCDHKHSDSGDTMFLICNGTSHEHMFKGVCNYGNWIIIISFSFILNFHTFLAGIIAKNVLLKML